MPNDAPAMIKARYTPIVDVVETPERLAALEPEWDELLDASDAPTIFLTWTWVSTWLETLGRDHRPLVVTARDPSDGSLVGMAPLAIENRKRLPLPPHRALVMIGAHQAAADHLDLVVRTGHIHVAEALWSAARHTGDWHLLDLDGLRPGSHLAGYALRTSEPISNRSSPCPYITLPGSWEDFRAGLGRNLRQNLGRYARKLDREASGEVRETLVSGPGAAEAAVVDLAALHRRSWAATGEATTFLDPGMVEFHRLLAPRLDRDGRLRLHRLDVGDRVAAIIYCFRHGDVMSFYQTGYDPELSRYGPGRRLMAAAIRSAIEEGAKEFDLLRGDEDHKRRWSTAVRIDRRIVSGNGLRGRVVHGAMRAGWAVRRMTESGR